MGKPLNDHHRLPRCLLLTLLLFCIPAVIFWFSTSSSLAGHSSPITSRDAVSSDLEWSVARLQGSGPTTPKLEGCVTCHGQIEPMHKYGTTETLDQLKDGKDAVGLTCTTCHGGNPVPRKTSDDPKEIERTKSEAHVRP